MAVNGLDDVLREVGLCKLARTHVHGQLQVTRVRLRGPSLELLARSVQHPVANWHDQATFFSQWYEHAGGHGIAPRGVPAQQGLGTDDVAYLIHLRLHLQVELLHAQCATQILLKAHALGHAVLHGRVKKAQGVATHFFGLVHGQVGLLKQD